MFQQRWSVTCIYSKWIWEYNEHAARMLNICPQKNLCRIFNIIFIVYTPQLSQVGVVDKRTRAAPWNEVATGGSGTSDKVHSAVYEEEHESVATSERVHLGPIGPPSK